MLSTRWLAASWGVETWSRATRAGLPDISADMTVKRPDVTDPTKRPPDLKRRLEWLALTTCTCPQGWRSGGRLYGISMMDTWVRLRDAPDCPHHGRTGRGH